MNPSSTPAESARPTADDRPGAESSLSGSRTTLDTVNGRLLETLLAARRPSDFVERGLQSASWIVLGKALLVAAAALMGVRVASLAVPLNPALYTAMFAAFGGVGAWLVIGGARDRGARSLGLFFVLTGLACARGASRTIAARMGGLAAVALSTDFVPLMPLCLWVFARDFPSAVGGRERRVVNVVAAVTAAAGAVLVAISLAAATGLRVPLTLLVGRPDFYWLTTFGLTALAFPYLVSRCVRKSTIDRARASWMLLSLVLGLAPLVLEVLAEVFVPTYTAWLWATDLRPVIGTALFACLLTLPFTTTYAVVSHRTLDVRIVLRRALQCSLTKYACALLCVLPLAWVAWRAYSHRAMSIQDVALQTSTQIGIAAASLGIIGLFFYPRVLDAVDRLFFGPRYDARAVSAGFRGAIWRTANASASAALLSRTATSVLSSASASVLLRVNVNGTYHDPAVDCYVRRDSKLIDVLARNRRGDIAVTDQLLASIDDEDAQWITRTTSTLLIPLRASTGEVLAVLGVGSRTDERPYYAEDRHLLGDLAVHASPILEQQLARGARRSQSSAPALVAIAGECPSCGLVVAAEDAAACPQCAIPLERSSLPPVLNGKYRVRARIGRGGMGVVYRAEDELLGRTVALKTLPYLSGLGELRSTAEGRAMAGVTHPNLAIVYGCELSIDRPVLVLEFLPGGTLNERLDGGPLSVGTSLRIVMSLCDGLGWLHRQGLSHGDIKPTNIGFSASGEPKLLDFGLAEALANASADSHGQSLRGTPQYRCPYHGSGSLAANDLWSLAAVLFECVTGRRLFDVMLSRPPAQSIDVRLLRPDLSPELAGVVNQSLSPDPALRPQSADEFRLWLERARPV